MIGALERLFGAARPEPASPWLQAVLWAWPELVIAACAIAIAIAAVRFRRRRGDLPTPYWRAGLAIVLMLSAVAISSLSGFLSLVLPADHVFRAVAAVAAVFALLSAFLARLVVPELLALPSASQLERANRHLKAEIQAHIETMQQLTDTRAELEQKVAQRTRELTEINQRFEAALSGSDIAVFTQDRNLNFTWAYDPRSGRLLGDVVGRGDEAFFPPAVAAEVTETKRGVIASGEGTSLNVAVASEDGGQQYLRLSIEPLRDDAGATIGLTSAIVDLTERHDYETRLSALTASLAQANARFDLALRGSTISVFSQDADLRYTWIYNPVSGLATDDLLGRRDDEVWSDPAIVRNLIAIKQDALESGEVKTGDVVLPIAGSDRHFKLRVEPIMGADQIVRGLAGAAVDVTEAREQQAHLLLVMRELTHRSKNLLAVIQAMARQTAARSDDPETFVARFSARLRAMAASQDLLVAQEWHGASLRELADAQLAQAVEPGSEQVKIDGADLSLKPDAAQNIGLALHELTTNASKYGALSTPEGRILLSWAIHGETFSLVWEERGGPEARSPERTGFGITLLSRTVGQALDGTVDLNFLPTGLVCTIDIPASHVKA